jgi:hypothetical protein
MKPYLSYKEGATFYYAVSVYQDNTRIHSISQTFS